MDNLLRERDALISRLASRWARIGSDMEAVRQDGLVLVRIEEQMIFLLRDISSKDA